MDSKEIYKKDLEDVNLSVEEEKAANLAFMKALYAISDDNNSYFINDILIKFKRVMDISFNRREKILNRWEKAIENIKEKDAKIAHLNRLLFDTQNKRK